MYGQKDFNPYGAGERRKLVYNNLKPPPFYFVSITLMWLSSFPQYKYCFFLNRILNVTMIISFPISLTTLLYFILREKEERGFGERHHHSFMLIYDSLIASYMCPVQKLNPNH